MTSSNYNDVDNPARQFVDALPAGIRRQVHRTQRLDGLIHQALGKGWTIAQLAERCTGDLGANPGGTITYRLERDAAAPPPRTGTTKVHAGCCEDGWIYLEDSDPPRQVKCPGNRPAEATA